LVPLVSLLHRSKISGVARIRSLWVSLTRMYRFQIALAIIQNSHFGSISLRLIPRTHLEFVLTDFPRDDFELLRVVTKDCGKISKRSNYSPTRHMTCVTITFCDFLNLYLADCLLRWCAVRLYALFSCLSGRLSPYSMKSCI
jgi:hypothetical protein